MEKQGITEEGKLNTLLSEQSGRFSDREQARAYLERIIDSSRKAGLGASRITLQVEESSSISLKYNGREIDALKIINDVYTEAVEKSRTYFKISAKDVSYEEAIEKVSSGLHPGHTIKKPGIEHLRTLENRMREWFLYHKIAKAKTMPPMKSASYKERTPRQRLKRGMWAS
jgi:hypothetical protein